MHKLNVLIAGSTGYIGVQLIKLLEEKTKRPLHLIAIMVIM